MAKPPSDFLVLAIDIGTSSTRAALFDRHARRLPDTASAQEHHVSYGADGRAELSPLDVLRSVTRARAETMAAFRRIPAGRRLPIVAIGGSALWHGLLGLDRRYRPITPIFTWADSRSAAEAKSLRSRLNEDGIQQRTGCLLRSTFWPAKLRWFRRSEPKVFRRVAYWVSPSDWIFHGLFGELACSASMASATGLYEFDEHGWSDDMIRATGIDRASLPCITDRFERQTTINGKDALVFSPIGDGAASNLGSGADAPLVVAVNVGTSAAARIVQNATTVRRRRIPDGLFRYVVDGSRCLTGGATSNAGNLRQWCLRELRLPPTPANLERALSREAAASNPLTVLPFWVEERAPTWPEGQLGVINGLTQTTTAEQIATACATGTYYRLAEIIGRMEGSLGKMRRIIVSGGIVKSLASLRLLADALGRDLEVSAEPEASLRGAAVHVLTQLGLSVTTPAARSKVKQHPIFAKAHRERRKRQMELEQLLTR